MKEEHEGSDSSVKLAMTRRSCTPAAPLTSTRDSSVMLSVSVEEALVDIRLIKDSLLEVQDTVRDLFAKVESLMADRSSARPDRSMTPAGTEREISDKDETSHWTVADTINQATKGQGSKSSGTIKEKQVEYKIDLPFSQRHYDTAAAPSFPKESLILLPFVTILQQLQKEKGIKSIEMDEVHTKIMKLDPCFFDPLSARSMSQYITKAQRWLDIVLCESSGTRIYFRNVEQPWLCKKRKKIPSWEEQRQEIEDFHKLPAEAVERFYTLLDALCELRKGPGWVGVTKLKSDLIVRDGARFESMTESDWIEYFEDAAKVCNIQLAGRSGSVDNIRRLEPLSPFRSLRFNQFYFSSKQKPLNKMMSTQSRHDRLDARGELESDIGSSKKRRLDL